MLARSTVPPCSSIFCAASRASRESSDCSRNAAENTRNRTGPRAVSLIALLLVWLPWSRRLDRRVLRLRCRRCRQQSRLRPRWRSAATGERGPVGRHHEKRQRSRRTGRSRAPDTQPRLTNDPVVSTYLGLFRVWWPPSQLLATALHGRRGGGACCSTCRPASRSRGCDTKSDRLCLGSESAEAHRGVLIAFLLGLANVPSPTLVRDDAGDQRLESQTGRQGRRHDR